MRQFIWLIAPLLMMSQATTTLADSDALHVLSVHDLIHMDIENEGDGERVIVRGYLMLGTGLRLYPTRDHALIWDTISALDVYEGEEADRDILMHCADSYVEILAQITYRESGIMWLLPSRVTTLKLGDTSLPDSEVCWAANTLLND